MNAKLKRNNSAIFLQALKIMVGSSIAIWIASLMNLQYATSAGIITLLTLVTTKLETMKLSLYRLISYCGSVVVALIVFRLVENNWISYGIYIFIVVFASEYVGWKPTISVNAVIGTHFMTERNFSVDFMINELMLVVIGISLAIILNAIHRNEFNEKRLLHNINYTELSLYNILGELASYLRCEESNRAVWNELNTLEEHLEHFIELACEYNNNVFDSEGNYYEQYFEMRMKQCGILHNLHFEMRKIRNLPEEAGIVAEFIMDMRNYVMEYQDCSAHLRRMTERFEDVVMYDVPKTREHFEARAKLYHILMDLEDFIVYKKRYIDAVNGSKRFERDKEVRRIKSEELKAAQEIEPESIFYKN